MAREAKKDPSELTVEEKLKALYQLQTMVSEIDKIKTLRGELPLEVQDLEDEVAGLSTRIEKIKAEIEELRSNIATKKIEIEAAKNSVEKYKLKNIQLPKRPRMRKSHKAMKLWKKERKTWMRKRLNWKKLFLKQNRRKKSFVKRLKCWKLL